MMKIVFQSLADDHLAFYWPYPFGIAVESKRDSIQHIATHVEKTGSSQLGEVSDLSNVDRNRLENLSYLCAAGKVKDDNEHGKASRVDEQAREVKPETRCD